MTKKIKGCERRGYVGVLGDMFLAQNRQCKGPEAGSGLDAVGTVRSPVWLENEKPEEKE